MYKLARSYVYALYLLVQDKLILYDKNSRWLIQGRSEGTSAVALKILIINCQAYFVNLFIFNCLNIKHKTVHLEVVLRQTLIFVLGKSCLSQTEENGLFMELWTHVFSSRF